MNSSFFRTTSIFFIISIIFIVLCFSTMVNSLSYSNEVTFKSSNIIIPDGTIISFSTSRLFMANSSGLLQLLLRLVIEMLQHLAPQHIILVLILVHHKAQIF